MRSIFVSYRRDDASAYAGRISDRLRARFGKESVFMDIDGIGPGADFISLLDQTLASCDLVIAVIGRGWLSAKDELGNRRLDHPGDFVAHEIATALSRGITVIPVLVGGASMPRPQDVPASLADLARRQAWAISDIGFHHQLNELIASVERIRGRSHRFRWAPVLPIRAISLVILVSVVLAGMWRMLPVRQSSSSTFVIRPISKQTTGGRVSGDAVLTPDGRHILYVVEESCKQAVWLRQVDGDAEVERIPASDAQYYGLTFTPDGSHLFFVATDKTDVGILYRAPLLSGSPQRILDDIDSAVAISPDGHQIAFLRAYPEKDEIALFNAASDGSAVQKIATRSMEEPFSMYSPTWSFNGASIMCRFQSTGASRCVGHTSSRWERAHPYTV